MSANVGGVEVLPERRRGKLLNALSSAMLHMLTIRVSRPEIFLRNHFRGPVPSGNHIAMTRCANSGVDDVLVPMIGDDLSRKP